MPTNRRPLKRQPRQPRRPASLITNEMLRLYARGLEIQKQGKTERWESEGGRRREYIDACVGLHRLLGRKLWDLDIVCDHRDLDEEGRQVRAQLEAALATAMPRTVPHR